MTPKSIDEAGHHAAVVLLGFFDGNVERSQIIAADHFLNKRLLHEAVALIAQLFQQRICLAALIAQPHELTKKLFHHLLVLWAVGSLDLFVVARDHGGHGDIFVALVIP